MKRQIYIIILTFKKTPNYLQNTSLSFIFANYKFFNIMKKLFLTLTIGVLLFSCKKDENQFQKNDWTAINLNGKVKYVKDSTYAESEESSYITEIWFDEKGKKIRDKMTELTNEDRKGYSSETTYKYNEKGNLIEESYDQDLLLSKTINKYNEKNQMTEKLMFDHKGNEFSKSLYKYDEKGNMVEKSDYDGDKLLSTEYFKYDEKGNQIEVNTSEGKDEIKVLYKYDEKGNQTEIATYRSGKLMSKTNMKYDEKNNDIELISDDEKIITKYTTYDPQGNWIEKVESITYNNSSAKSTTKRTIEYH